MDILESTMEKYLETIWEDPEELAKLLSQVYAFAAKISERISALETGDAGRGW